MPSDLDYMRQALRLARRGYGATSPNPVVGAVLVQRGEIIGRGWHRRAGEPHAEIEALRDAQRQGCNPKGATLYVTLEPCCTHGRTPPCTEAILAAGIKRVVIGATDPNPQHCGKAFGLLERAGVSISPGVLAGDCERLNEAFNHWIVHRAPLVTVKAAMTLDGRIATAAGQSKWITGERARAAGMRLRQGADAILVGINTVLADDPSLTWRRLKGEDGGLRREDGGRKRLRRIILDSRARTPLAAKVVNDSNAGLTTIVVTEGAPKSRVQALAERVKVLVAPVGPARVKNQRSKFPDLSWLMRRLGAENVTNLLVEGGGEVNGSFLFQGLAHRIAFFYAPKILGGRDARLAVAGEGAASLDEALNLRDLEWRRLGPDWLLTAQVAPSAEFPPRELPV